MENATPSQEVSSTVKQHEAMQKNLEDILRQSPNLPSYPMTATGAQFGEQYDGQYSGYYGDVTPGHVDVAIEEAPEHEVGA